MMEISYNFMHAHVSIEKEIYCNIFVFFVRINIDCTLLVCAHYVAGSLPDSRGLYKINPEDRGCSRKRRVKSSATRTSIDRGGTRAWKTCHGQSESRLFPVNSR